MEGPLLQRRPPPLTESPASPRHRRADPDHPRPVPRRGAPQLPGRHDERPRSDISETLTGRWLEVWAKMPAVFEQAAEGEWDPLRGQAHAIRGLIAGHDFNLGLMYDAVITMRASAYPLLIRSDSSDADALVRLLSGFDELIAWFLHELSGPTAASHFDLERDALFLRSVVENIPYMIFVKDARRPALRALQQGRRGAAGLLARPASGEERLRLLHPEEADRFTRDDRTVLEGTEVVDIPDEPIDTTRPRPALPAHEEDPDPRRRGHSPLPARHLGGHHRAQAGAAGAGTGQGSRRERQPGQERVPGPDEPRDPHADERASSA